MDAKRAFVHAGKYFALTSLLAIVGFGLFIAGLAYGWSQGSVVEIMGTVTRVPGTGSIPGFLLGIVGLVIWRFGKAWAFYKTLPTAIEDEVSDTFDTQHVKSDIVAILDDRLNDMQQDLQSVNRELRELKEANSDEDEQFAFDEQ